MSLKAIIPAGITEITVNGLHQWDYGRKLEIHSPALPAVVEIHFACTGMDEAIVRVGSAVDGSVAVSIPDRCLEQSAPITAWVYEVGENNGQTIQTITLNVTPRVRPQTCGEVPIEISDKYTEAMGAMNEAVDDLKTGEVKVKKAEYADNAAHTPQADHADEADHAVLSTAATTVRVNDLDEIKTLLLNRPFQTFGVSVGNAPISVANVGTIPAWSLGTAVTDPTGIRLCLTNVEKNTVTVYGNYDAEKNEWVWRFMPESAKKISGAGVYTPGLYCVNVVVDGTRTTHMLSIENLDDTVFSIAGSSGSVATYWGTTRQVTVPTNMELESLVCVAPYIF